MRIRTSTFLLTLFACSMAQADEASPSAFDFSTAYTAELWHEAQGGIATGTRALDNLSITLAVDGAPAFGLPGMHFFGSVLFNNGAALNDELTGSTQGVSNIETTHAIRLFESWSEWQANSGERSLRFGLYDLNSEFDHIDVAGLFINPSHGIGVDFAQSGTNGPSIFPVTSLAIRALNSVGPWTLQAAVLDGSPGDATHPDRSGISLSRHDGILGIGELNYRVDTGTRAGIGYWRYSSQFDDLATAGASGDVRQRDDNSGVYAIVQSPALSIGSSNRTLQAYTRFGVANDRVNEISQYLGAGIVGSGLFGTRAEDRLGIAMAIATLGDPASRLRAESGEAPNRREYNYELTGQFPIGELFTLQADVQYVIHPGMDPGLRPAWLFGLRITVAQSWSR